VAAVVYRGKRRREERNASGCLSLDSRLPYAKGAQNELNKLLRSLDDGTYAEASKQTVAEFLERWLTTAHLMSGDDEKAAKTTDDIYRKRSTKKGKKRVE
jgi:hypothetical protein